MGLGLVGFLGLAAAGAEVRPLEFLRALQQKDYHDAAVDYLEMLKEKGQLPEELAAVWDLEMYTSLRGWAASRAFDPKDFEQLMGQAEKHLKKFLQERPNHPEALNAQVSWGMLSMDRALKHLRAARLLADKDKAQQAKHLTEARALLEAARSQFKQAIERFQARIATVGSMPQKPGPRGKPVQDPLADLQGLQSGLLGAQFQAALLDYYVAQTYTDPNAPARKAALNAAAKALDAIWQLLRYQPTPEGGVSVLGLYAHMWHGKIADELGDYELAQDIYEEVLSSAPDPDAKSVDKTLEPLFAQVQQFAFAILAREDPEQFLKEATDWLRDYAKRWRHTEGYQGVALEVAKARLAQAARASGAEKTRLTKEALTLLGDMRRVASPYQQEALALWREHTKTLPQGTAAEAKTFEQAIGLGDAAMAAGQWDAAVSAYSRAWQLSSASRDAARIAAAKEKLANAKYAAAAELYRANKLEECLRAAELLADEDKTSPIAPQAASLAVAAALNLYVNTPPSDPQKKQAALHQLERIAQYTETHWPGKPEADEARIYRGQALLARGELDKALAAFDSVSPKSPRYPRALSLAAAIHWQRYLALRMAGGADKSKLAAQRAKAFQMAQAGLEGMNKLAEPGKPLSPHHIEAQYLVAAMHFEADEHQQAVALLEPLVEMIKASKAEPDSNTVRICVIAVQSYLRLGETARAGQVSMVLADSGADIPAVNAVLVEFVRTLELARKQADAELIQAVGTGDAKAIDQAKARLASTQGMIGNVLKKLITRKNFTVQGTLVIAEAAAAVGLRSEAAGLLQQVLRTAEADPKAKTRARAQLVGLLRAEGKFQQAYDEVKQLVADNPRALEPLMEQGRILQAWAETDLSKFDEAVAHWTRVRNLLQPPLGRRPRFAEYYEVIYNAAYCLFLQAQRTPASAEQKAIEAMKLLKSAMVLNEKLSGPDMVARYDRLLADLERLVSASKSRPASK